MTRLLCLALAGLLEAGAVPQASADDPVLATVNGHVIRRSDVQAGIAAMPLGDQIVARQQTERFGESVIREEVLFQYMLATDFASAPALRKRVRELVVEELINQEVTARLQISDADVRAFFDDNPAAIRGEYAQFYQVLLAERPQCESLQETISTSGEFASAAREHSLHRSSAESGGDIGLIMNHSGPLGFEQALFDLQPGQMAVFDSEDGCHLVRMGKRVTPPIPPIENVAPAIRGFLKTRRERELLSALLERTREFVQVTR